MRRLKKPTLRESVGPLAFGLFILVSGLIFGSDIATTVAMAVGVTALLLFLSDADPGDDACEKCGHLRNDHHGPCQQCLRDVASRSADARTVPCSRFELSNA